eukprot:Blabericola_migrator_1__4274@NODE_230_length_11080_cov_61_366385_g196_i0_p1_GENE_NODE_230_length_11080_cov_61_366385_g196_i0NODE_230_length_11080_cov_61_366385_g196_i0_p1_ORF_typecomplete_len2107_score350_96Sfi1/PF08457_10/56Sfi1/PF08457_10/11Sfi1/PF08457_10/2_7e02Sfi1/PF08457_10/0_19Sfi1/PF08457_10/1_4e05Sfi1/PF08457_10/3_2e02Sfi1/PF08457_10/2_3Sfi1/PF08457_10/1_8e04_NODE_230_length_11080_cov_61_366385_g196_i028489168
MAVHLEKAARNIRVRRYFDKWLVLSAHRELQYRAWRLKLCLRRWRRQVMIAAIARNNLLLKLTPVAAYLIDKLLSMLNVRTPDHPYGIPFREEQIEFFSIADQALKYLVFRKWLRRAWTQPREFIKQKRQQRLARSFHAWILCWKHKRVRSATTDLKYHTFVEKWLMGRCFDAWVGVYVARTELKIRILEFVNARVRRQTMVWLLRWRQQAKREAVKRMRVQTHLAREIQQDYLEYWMQGFVHSRRQRLVAHKFETRILRDAWETYRQAAKDSFKDRWGIAVLKLSVINFWRREAVVKVQCQRLRQFLLMAAALRAWTNAAQHAQKIQALRHTRAQRRLAASFRQWLKASYFYQGFRRLNKIITCLSVKKFFSVLSQLTSRAQQAYRTITFRYRRDVIKRVLKSWHQLTLHRIKCFARGCVLSVVRTATGQACHDLLPRAILEQAKLSDAQWVRLTSLVQPKLSKWFFLWYKYTKVQSSVKSKVFTLVAIDRRTSMRLALRAWLRSVNSMRMGRRIMSTTALSRAREHLQSWRSCVQRALRMREYYLLIRNTYVTKLILTRLRAWYNVVCFNARQNMLLYTFVEDRARRHTIRILQIWAAWATWNGNMKRKKRIIQQRTELRIGGNALTLWALAFAQRKKARKLSTLWLRIQSRVDLIVVVKRWRRAASVIGVLEKVETSQYELYRKALVKRAFTAWHGALISLKLKDCRFAELCRLHTFFLKARCLYTWAGMVYQSQRLREAGMFIERRHMTRILKIALQDWIFITAALIRLRSRREMLIQASKLRLAEKAWRSWLLQLLKQFLVTECLMATLNKLLGTSMSVEFVSSNYEGSTYVLTGTEPQTLTVTGEDERHLRLNDLRRHCLLYEPVTTTTTSDPVTEETGEYRSDHTGSIPRSIWSSVNNTQGSSEGLAPNRPRVIMSCGTDMSMSDVIMPVTTDSNMPKTLSVAQVPLPLCLEALYAVQKYVRQEVPIEAASRTLILIEDSIDAFTDPALTHSKVDLTHLTSRLFAARFHLQALFLTVLVTNVVKRRRVLMEWKRFVVHTRLQEMRCAAMYPRVLKKLLQHYFRLWKNQRRASISQAETMCNIVQRKLKARCFEHWQLMLVQWKQTLAVAEETGVSIVRRIACAMLAAWRAAACQEICCQRKAMQLRERLPYVLLQCRFKQWKRLCDYVCGVQRLEHAVLKKSFYRFKRATEDMKVRSRRIQMGVTMLTVIVFKRHWRECFYYPYVMNKIFTQWQRLCHERRSEKWKIKALRHNVKRARYEKHFRAWYKLTYILRSLRWHRRSVVLVLAWRSWKRLYQDCQERQLIIQSRRIQLVASDALWAWHQIWRLQINERLLLRALKYEAFVRWRDVSRDMVWIRVVKEHYERERARQVMILWRDYSKKKFRCRNLCEVVLIGHNKWTLQSVFKRWFQLALLRQEAATQLTSLSRLLTRVILRYVFEQLCLHKDVQETHELNFNTIFRSYTQRLQGRAWLVWHRRVHTALRLKKAVSILSRVDTKASKSLAIRKLRNNASWFKTKLVLNKFCKAIEKSKYLTRFGFVRLKDWTILLEQKIGAERIVSLKPGFEVAAKLPTTLERQCIQWWRTQTRLAMSHNIVTQLRLHWRIDSAFSSWRLKYVEQRAETAAVQLVRKRLEPHMLRSPFMSWQRITVLQQRGSWLSELHGKTLMLLCWIAWLDETQAAEKERFVVEAFLPLLQAEWKRQAIDAFRSNVLMTDWKRDTQHLIDTYAAMIKRKLATEHLRQWNYIADMALRIKVLNLMTRRNRLNSAFSALKRRYTVQLNKKFALRSRHQKWLKLKGLSAMSYLTGLSLKLRLFCFRLTHVSLQAPFQALRNAQPARAYRPQQLVSPNDQQRLFIKQRYLAAARDNSILSVVFRHWRALTIATGSGRNNLSLVLRNKRLIRKAWLTWRWAHRLRVSTRGNFRPAVQGNSSFLETLKSSYLNAPIEIPPSSPTDSLTEFSKTVNEISRLRRELQNSDNASCAVADEGIITTRVRHMMPKAYSPPYFSQLPVESSPSQESDTETDLVLRRIGSRHGVELEAPGSVQFLPSDGRIIPASSPPGMTMQRIETEQFMKEEWKLFNARTFVGENSPPTFGDEAA